MVKELILYRQRTCLAQWIFFGVWNLCMQPSRKGLLRRNLGSCIYKICILGEINFQPSVIDDCFILHQPNFLDICVIDDYALFDTWAKSLITIKQEKQGLIIDGECKACKISQLECTLVYVPSWLLFVWLNLWF